MGSLLDLLGSLKVILLQNQKAISVVSNDITRPLPKLFDHKTVYRKPNNKCFQGKIYLN